MRDHRFFFWLAVAMTATIFIGFPVQFLLGRSTFAVPAIVHVHAAVFFGWTLFYLLQNWLVASGSVTLHRRLGWLAVGWATVIVVLCITMTVLMVRRDGERARPVAVPHGRRRRRGGAGRAARLSALSRTAAARGPLIDPRRRAICGGWNSP